MAPEAVTVAPEETTVVQEAITVALEAVTVAPEEKTVEGRQEAVVLVAAAKSRTPPSSSATRECWQGLEHWASEPSHSAQVEIEAS